MGTPISKSPSNCPQPVGFEAVRDQLRRIAASAVFSESERLRSLLSFLITQTLLGNAAEIKESVIAVEVFHRPAHFAPRSDSLVRVQVRNLRRKLDEYYAGEGLHDPVRIALPKGTYVPQFRFSSGDGETAPGPEAPGPPIAARGRMARMAAVAAIAMVALSAGWLARPAKAPEAGSLAVLPFANTGADTGRQYLSESFADELMSVLGKRSGLRVAARNVAFEFKGIQANVRAVAGRLQVASVLEGEIQPYGDRMKVAARLVDGRTGRPLWSQSFDQPIGEAGTALDGIASGVSAALRVASPPARVHRPAPEVQDLYLRGVYLRAQRDAASRETGFQYLEQAATRDEAYAPAQSAVAMICAARCYHAAPHRAEWAEKARERARSALAADETDPKAHCALAWVNWIYDRDWPAAEAGFRRARQLNPSYAGAHNLYALALTTRGRFAEALAEAERARELDPTIYLVSTDLALIHYFARQFADAEKLAKSMLAVDPGFAPAHLLIADCLTGRKQYTEALHELRSLDAGDDVEFLGRLGYLLARTGDKAAALDAARRISTVQSGGDVYGSTALIYAGLGDSGKAFEWLNQAADHRETSVVFAGVDPFLDGLRRDPRFDDLRGKLGL